MALSTDIRLPKDVTPRFPNRCVYSGEPDPDAQAFVIANSRNGFLTFHMPLLLVTGWQKVYVPVLKRCRWRFYFQVFGRDLMIWLLAAAAIIAFMPLLAEDRAFRRFKIAGLVLIVISPWILFELFVPRRFDVTVSKDWIDYQFASKEYADEFAQLNAEHLMRTA